jgi:lambda family phage portal protein
MIKELNAGDEIQVVNPTGQATDAAQYIKLQQRLIGAGQGLSYEATSRDMSQSNYSSARQGIIEDEQTYIEDTELFREVFLDEVYESFVVSGVLSGLFDIPDFWDPEKREQYLAHEWVAAPKRWIDPLKETNAMRVALQTGQKTFQQACAENGQDWKKVIEAMAEAREYGLKHGIELGGIIYGQKPENLDIEDDEEESSPVPVPAVPVTGIPAGTEQAGQADKPADGTGQAESGPEKGN